MATNKQIAVCAERFRESSEMLLSLRSRKQELQSTLDEVQGQIDEMQLTVDAALLELKAKVNE